MKLFRDLAVVAVTAVLVAPLARPHAARADGEEKRVPPPPAVFHADGVDVTLSGKPTADGAEAVATLTAVNRRDAVVERKVRVRMTVTPKPQRRSRMLLLPKEKWTREVTLRLKPGETKTVTLRTAVKLAKGESATFTAGDKRPTLLPRVVERSRRQSGKTQTQ
jgi:hypothetical protein